MIYVDVTWIATIPKSFFSLFDDDDLTPQDFSK
jgi:hypothetical protein